MRVKGMFAPGDFPAGDDEKTDADRAALFAGLFPGVAGPAFDAAHSGLAAVAHNPQVALHLGLLSRAIVLETAWCRRADLRELAIQTVNLRFAYTFSLAVRRPHALAAGIDAARLAALPDWRRSSLFDAEQRQVIAFAEAVIAGDVPDALFADARARYGEAGTMAFVSLVAIWSAWAMIINAVRPAPPPAGDAAGDGHQ